jgi:hypothetical protein
LDLSPYHLSPLPLFPLSRFPFSPFSPFLRKNPLPFALAAGFLNRFLRFLDFIS